MAAPSFRSVGAFASGAGPSVTPGLPSGWQADDLFLMFAGFGRMQTDPVISTPAGWNLLYSGNLVCPLVFWRVATGSETAPTLTVANVTALNARIIAIRNVRPTDWLDAEMTATGTSSTAFSIPAGNGTSGPEELVVAAVWGFTDINSTNQIIGWSAPGVSSWTERCDNWSAAGSGYGGFAVATGTRAASGDIGQISGNLDNATPWRAYRFAIRPVPTTMIASGSIAGQKLKAPAAMVGLGAKAAVVLPGCAITSPLAETASRVSIAAAMPEFGVTLPVASAATGAAVSADLPATTLTAPEAMAGTVTLASGDVPGCLVYAPSGDARTGASADGAMPATTLTAPEAMAGARIAVAAPLPGVAVGRPEASASVSVAFNWSPPRILCSPPQGFVRSPAVTPVERRAIVPTSRLATRRTSVPVSRLSGRRAQIQE